MEKRLPKDTRLAATLATITATLMIAQQIGAKSLRDTFFLTHFPVEKLPLLTIGAAVVSLGMVVVMSRILSRLGPKSVVPGLFFLSAALYVIEWKLSATFPRFIAVMIFLHTVTFGASAASGFWSLMNEQFDPHVAKRVIGRIGTGATLGGLLGGLAVWQGVKFVELETLLLFLMGFNGFCGAMLFRISKGNAAPVSQTTAPATPKPAASKAKDESGSYLATIGAFVLLSGLSIALFDYVFKARAADTFTERADLAGFFALFYTVVSALTFAVQTGLVSRVLVRFGLPAGLSVMPTVGLIFGLGAGLVFGLPSMILLRGLSSIAENSFFRSAYELLYTPLSPERKRATKLLIDVGADRLGTTLGGGLALLLLGLFAGELAERILLVFGAVGTGGLLGILVWLHRGYVSALTASMRRGQADHLDEDLQVGLDQKTIHQVLDRTMAQVSVQDLLQASRSMQGTSTKTALPQDALNRLNDAVQRYRATLGQSKTALKPTPSAVVHQLESGDPMVRCIEGLRSSEVSNIENALRHPACTQPEMVAHLIPLLANPAVSESVQKLLSRQAARSVGQLYDILLSPRYPAAIRSRVAHILATAPETRSAYALQTGLSDDRFEVRHASAVALYHVCLERPSLKPDRKLIFELVEAELAQEHTTAMYERYTHVATSPFADVVDRDLPAFLIHVFTLLGIVVDASALLLTFRTLADLNAATRGTALEYLDNVLPASTRTLLSQRIDGPHGLAHVVKWDGTHVEALGRALGKKEIDLAELRARYRGPAPA